MATRERFRPAIASIGSNPWFVRAFGLFLGFLGWTLLASRFPNELMPYPDEALELAWGLVQTGEAWPHVRVTLWRTLLGFVGSLLLGGALGVMMGVSEYGQRFFTPYVVIGLSIPAIAWAAAATLIFGLSLTSPVVATVLTTFPYIAINIWKGVETIEPELADMSKAFEVSRRRRLLRFILPSTAPFLFSASRFGLAISWKIVTIAELFASSSGVGYKLWQSYQQFRFEEAWAWAILFILVILLIEYAVMKPIENRVFEHRHDVDFTLVG